MNETVQPLVTVEDLACGYGGKAVARGINLVLQPGDFFALIGVNGSGKSTFLKTVAGLIPPVDGTVRFAGGNRKAAPLGYIPQTEKLDSIFPISVLEVVVMGTYARLGPGRRLQREQWQAAESALRRMGVQDLSGHRFAELSGGQKQRVLLARALVTEPLLLVLDEPTSGVDPAAERSFMELIAEVNRQGVAVLMASHNLALVREFAPRAMWFHDGRVESGPGEEILRAVGVAGQRPSFL